MEKRMENWKDLKFGLFIHFGLYSLLGEDAWAMFQRPMDIEEYAALTDQFDTPAFSAADWVQAAKDAGMQYMVVTARHHDGFSLFDSKAAKGGFTSIHAASGRDYIGEYTAACREAGLKVGVYYSPLDWRFPGYFLPRLYQKSARELVEQCHGQVRELMTQYGKIDILWFDGGEDYWLCHGANLHAMDNMRPEDFREHPQIPDFWKAKELNQMARELQPGIVINNRSGRRQFGDYLTPEGRIGEMNTTTPWETCDTLAGYWGWKPNGMMRSLRECIALLVRVVTGDGNLLLNVGPRPDGSIEPEQVQRLKEIGQWLACYGESIYQTRGGPIPNGPWGGCTWKGNKLYVHVLEWKRDTVRLPLANAAVKRIFCLTGQQAVSREEAGILHLSIPAEQRECMDTIFVLEYEKSVPEAFKGTSAGTFEQGKQYLPEGLIV